MTTKQPPELTDEQKALFDQLTKLQGEVCLGMLSGLNQSDAYKASSGKAKSESAIRAGATEILAHPHVKAFMDSMKGAALSSAVLTRQEAMELLSDLARTSMTDLVEYGSYELGEDQNGNPIIQSAWKIKDSAMQDPRKMASISELTAGRDGIKIKQHSRLQAIKQLQEMEGWNSAKKLDVTNSDGSLKPRSIDATKLSTEALQELLKAKNVEE